MTKEQLCEYQRRRHEDAKPAYDALMSCYPFTLDDLPGEQWKDIDGYGGVYQVSTFGRVKSFKGTKPRILKPVLRGEYLSVAFYIDGKQKHRLVHVLVARAFIPNPENKPEVNHDDGHKFNCHVSNLLWATSAENKQHALKTGLKKTGLENPTAKIKNESDIIYIRDNPDKLTQRQLAEKFGVTVGIISLIQTGKKYPNVSGTIRESKIKRVTGEIRAAILADWATGQYTQRELARKFGYNCTTIWKIVHEV